MMNRSIISYDRLEIDDISMLHRCDNYTWYRHNNSFDIWSLMFSFNQKDKRDKILLGRVPSVLNRIKKAAAQLSRKNPVEAARK